MITIDALGKDGRNILGDLEGCSPAGGPVRTQWRAQYELRPGDVVRGTDCYWEVIAGLSHDGMTGITRLALVRPDNTIHSEMLVCGDGADVRQDTRIDPDTLWKLAELAHAAEPERVGQVAS